MFLIDGFFSERTVIANQKRTGRKHFRAFELSTGTTRSGHDHFCSRAIEFGNLYNCVGGSKWTSWPALNQFAETGVSGPYTKWRSKHFVLGPETLGS